ncbi:dipeptide/oligopeptide/nickel ABC transporter permease/ATP-binding protein [Sulfitobacter sp. F26204]|uniref:dipeptide/oligopeptide/nickel ABC transporter permease/ATP-binding protein n=1 Tax=Sulfitobacter sp. F26204 TaxID=2996014 RepID=UPI00225E5883|nr:dipeptide/oligopeptide/nickel ABC transporter permease/ATP-binding protein [Sulfitobacter sp. F26204]MCX7560991.1 dipeptide/oligopeptide/nickel ABC transporter permease/ATP-binding protein [Sulfitobacter sp. F26204]
MTITNDTALGKDRDMTQAPFETALEQTAPKRPNFLMRLISQPATVLALLWVFLLIIVAIFAEHLAPADPNASNVMDRLRGMSLEHLAGTDDLGRDLLSRAMWGARVALLAVVMAVGPAILVGVPLGLFVAYRGGWWDRIIMRLLEVEQAIPMLLLAFTFIAILGRGLTNAMLAVSVGFAMSYLRLTRAIVLAETPKAYVQAAEVQGYSTPRILFRHILPNAIGPIAVQTSILAGVAILLEAMLSFLGLGVGTGSPSWGAMLDDARRFQLQQPLLSLVPGIAITLTVLAFNLLGDGFRDAFNSDIIMTKRKKERLLPAAPIVAPEPFAQEPDSTEKTVLSLDKVSVEFPGHDGAYQKVVNKVSLSIKPGQIYGLVGESGSGKSMTSSAILGQVPKPGRISEGSIRLGTRELVGLSDREMRQIRGRDIGAVFQDPMMALSPVHKVGDQMIEGLVRHEGISRKKALVRAAELLDLVGVADARNRLNEYPHQFSGGMAQRAMIAAALICKPQLLIADEPTTALDATVQKQVLELLRELRDTLGMSILFITHDLAVVGQLCDRVGFMKLGELVEEGTAEELFSAPKHPYTRQLMQAREVLDGPIEETP